MSWNTANNINMNKLREIILEIVVLIADKLERRFSKRYRG
jgi:hypothetical protein